MISTRAALALAVSSIALIQSHAALAQTAPLPADDPAAATAEAVPTDIVVTGTRTVGRSRLDSSSPVDVLSAAALQRQGSTELAASLAAIVPSIDFPRSSAVDGTDSIRPATLRGLAPDQTLVLINGVRAHTSALVNTNGSVGRGSAAVDLNTIPSVALDRIEVLRDGAAAQYGSDAIAGVVNLRLREARSGGGFSTTYGQYVTKVTTARGERDERDGETLTTSAWVGLPIGQTGFLTLSGEYLNRNATSRGDFDPRKTPIRVRSRFGDPAVDQFSLYGNAGVPLGGSGGWQLYAFGGYQARDSESAATPRIVGGTGGNLNASADALASFYPDGFTPLIAVESTDLTATGGVRGDIGGWKVDLNVSYGRNKLAFFTRNSGNATYGAASPTSFYDGSLTYDQLVGGADVSKELALGSGTLNVAFGAEYRREGFAIGAGDPTSYNRLPGSSSALGSGAQGFPGFQPSNVVNVHRENVSGYIDLEAKPIEGLTLGAAVRGEHYSDFGEVATGKLSARYALTPWFAIRGTASTGFRAPSLQQQYFTSTASVLSNGNIVETGLFPSVSPVGIALGGKPLRPEKSRNLSAGFVLKSGGFDLSVDAYQIKLRDQIALSENLSGTVVAALLAPYNVTAGRYFLNGIRSTTKGIDVVAHYRIATGGFGTFDLTAAANFNDIRVTRAPAPATITAIVNGVSTSATLPIFSRQRIISFEQGTPREKVIGTIDWSLKGWGLTARGSYYGDVTQPGNTGFAEEDIHTGRKTVFDLEARVQVQKNVNLALGANNVFDIYPDYVRVASSRNVQLNSTGLVGFPYYSPFGFNGRYLYARVGVKW